MPVQDAGLSAQKLKAFDSEEPQTGIVPKTYLDLPTLKDHLRETQVCLNGPFSNFRFSAKDSPKWGKLWSLVMVILVFGHDSPKDCRMTIPNPERPGTCLDRAGF